MDNIWQCESCKWTATTANGAATHETNHHDGAQTMWTTQDRDKALAGQSR